MLRAFVDLAFFLEEHGLFEISDGLALKRKPDFM
jgi:hypothetical protein